MIYAYGKTLCWHTHPVLSRYHQTTADHAHGVATILVDLWPGSSKEAIFYALHHDTAEGFVGDTPFPAKQRHPMLKTALDQAEAETLRKLGIRFNITDQECRRVRLCDRIERILFVQTYAQQVFDTTERDDWENHCHEIMCEALSLGVDREVGRMMPRKIMGGWAKRSADGVAACG